MKKKIAFLVFIIASLCLTLLFSGGQQGKGSDDSSQITSDEVTITDALGREITIPSTAKRVVTLGPAVREAFKVLHASDLIIGSDQWPLDGELFSEKFPPVNGTGTSMMQLDYEKIMELNPDIVIALPFMGISPQDIMDKLCPEITVVFLALGQVDVVADNFRPLGKLIGKEAVAEDFIAFNDGILNKITTRISTIDIEDRPKVLFKAPGASPDQFSTYSNGSVFGNTLITLPGGINLADDLPSSIAGWVEDVNPEWLIEQNIDIIIDVVYSPYLSEAFGYAIVDPSHVIARREKLMNMSILKDSHAVYSDAVYMIESDLTFTIRGIFGTAQVAKWFYPELFSDINVQKLHQRYLTEFLSVDIDLETQGLFYYPDLK